MKILKSFEYSGRLLAAGTMLLASFGLHAEINTSTLAPGNAFDLYAKPTQISTPDGDSLRLWTFAPGSPTESGVAQYPGPSLVIEQGATVVIYLHNEDLDQPVTLEFPGQEGVSCSGTGTNCEDGITMAEATTLTYSFTASKAGTYLYMSGISPQVQVDMGLVGALIVRPAATEVAADGAPLAYPGESQSAYDREYMFVLSEMDPKLHYMAEDGNLANWDNGAYSSVLFFMNGRNGPDTLAPSNHGILPNQPYNSLVQMYPGERVLIRVINVGRTQHPLHLHGNHFNQISRDGNLIKTTGKDGLADVGVLDYTYNAIPGGTADLVFEWTGKGLGWDIYDPTNTHSCSDTKLNRPDLPAVGTIDGVTYFDGYDDASWEWCPDHGKEMPVVIPENQDLAFGGFYSGSPYIGTEGSLPIGEGGLNPSGGLVYMWHSHSERELTNNDIYPGGMLTMLIIDKRPPAPAAP